MAKLIPLILIFALGALPASASAAGDDAKNAPQKPIATAAARELTRLTRDPQFVALTSVQNPNAQPSWVRRHPVLVGALIGAGAGVVMGATMENELICSGGDEDCLVYGSNRFTVGAAIGAGVGSLVGLLVGAAHK